MANPAAEARGKAQAIWPGASVFARGRKSIAHQHPSDPDRFMFDTAIGPMHFGADQEIDTAWQTGTAPWDFEMVKAGYNAFALEDFSSGQIIKYVDPINGEDIAFQPQQLQYTNDLGQIQPIADPQSVNAVVTDDELYWTGAFGTDIDLKWQAQTARLDKRLIVQNLAALPAVQQFITDGGNPVLRLQFIFQHSNGVSLFVNDVEWDERANNPVETSGIVEFRDSSNNVLWVFNLPRSEDQDDEFIGAFRFRKTGPNLFVEHLVPVSWLQGAVYPVEIDVTVDEQVGGNDDDAYETDTGSGFTASSNLNRFYAHATDGTRRNTGARFTTVAVPQGATIDVAYLEYYFYSTDFDDVDANITFNDVDNAVDFATDADVTTRVNDASTTANVDWDDTAIGASTWGQSPSIVTVVKEIVDRGSWSTGNAMVALVAGETTSTYDTRARAHDYDTSLAPKLHIEYTAGAAAIPNKITQVEQAINRAGTY